MTPVDDETVKEVSKAVAESAKFGQGLVAGARELGAFIGRVLGTTPEDTVGVLGGDWVHEFRTRNLHRLRTNTDRILADRRTAIEGQRPVSPRIAVPLLRAAFDESDEILQEFWARLLANAMDPGRDEPDRLSFVRTLQDLDPPDAKLLDAMYPNLDGMTGFEEVNFKDAVEQGKIDFYRDPLSWQVSLRRLATMSLIVPREGGVIDGKYHVTSKFYLTEYGFAFLKSCRR